VNETSWAHVWRLRSLYLGTGYDIRQELLGGVVLVVGSVGSIRAGGRLAAVGCLAANRAAMLALARGHLR
jgi:hypothetical protein